MMVATVTTAASQNAIVNLRLVAFAEISVIFVVYIPQKPLGIGCKAHSAALIPIGHRLSNSLPCLRPEIGKVFVSCHADI